MDLEMPLFSFEQLFIENYTVLLTSALTHEDSTVDEILVRV